MRKNSDSSYSVKLPNVHSRQSITVELTGEMKNVATLELVFKEFATDAREKKQQVQVVNQGQLMSLAETLPY